MMCLQKSVIVFFAFLISKPSCLHSLLPREMCGNKYDTKYSVVSVTHFPWLCHWYRFLFSLPGSFETAVWMTWHMWIMRMPCQKVVNGYAWLATRFFLGQFFSGITELERGINAYVVGPPIYSSNFYSRKRDRASHAKRGSRHGTIIIVISLAPSLWLHLNHQNV